MIQPVLGAIEAWLAIFSSLPFPITALVSLAIFLFIASRIIVIVWESR